MNLAFRVLAFNDAPSSAPARRYPDWTRSMPGLQILSPKANEFVLTPGEVLRVFDGVRSSSIDGTTQFTLSLSTLDDTRYRFAHSGGTAPALRTDRGLALVGQTLTLVANANSTLSLSSSTVGAFAAVQVSDIIFFPGVSTGDAATNFDDRNSDEWAVIAKDGTSTTLQLARLPGVDFTALGQAALVAANTDIQAWSAAGVQVGDKVKISAGFSTPVIQTYTILKVTPKRFEVVATGSLPVAQVAIPGSTGITFYTKAKKFLYVEMDQEGEVRCNGATDDRDTMSPFYPGNPEGVAVFVKTGPTWTLDLVNRAAVPLTALVISAE